LESFKTDHHIQPRLGFFIFAVNTRNEVQEEKMRHCERNTYYFTGLAVCILLLNGIYSEPALAGASLIDLGVLPGYTGSSASGVSANGKVVIGTLSSAAGGHAFRWTRGEGMTDLGVLPGGNWSRAYAASPNGAAIVGAADDSTGVPRLFLWSRQAGMTDIGPQVGQTVAIMLFRTMETW
jgi:probable HAF family extracellular repeat protein